MRSLWVRGTPVTDSDLASLGPLRELIAAELGYSGVTDRGAASLLNYPSLKYVFLWGTKITDETITVLAKMSGLRLVNVSDTGVTQSGFDELNSAAELLGEPFRVARSLWHRRSGCATLGSKVASNAINLNVRSGKLTMCSSIRVATPDDEPAAALLERQAFEDLRHIYKPKDNAAPATSPGIRVVAETADRRIIGTVRYEIDADKVCLRGLAVEGRHRRAGIAAALVRDCQGVATSAGVRVLSLYTIKETGNIGFFDVSWILRGGRRASGVGNRSRRRERDGSSHGISRLKPPAAPRPARFACLGGLWRWIIRR